MKFVEPNVEYWSQEAGMEGVWKQIARATRICYQSEAREDETDEEFVKRVVFKPALIAGDLNELERCEFDNLKIHGAMLEHGTVYIVMPYTRDYGRIFFKDNKYSNVNRVNGDYRLYITTNVRVLVEGDMLDYIKDYIVEMPTEYHTKRYTFSVTTDIGVTREMNRHRTFSVAEQSTRYCDFNKDKFGEELTFIRPAWWKDIQVKETDIMNYETYLSESEYFYKMLRNQGWKPEQARQVLPLGLKTQAIYTAFEDDWKHFLKLRADNVSGKVHPNMAVVANIIKDKFKEITSK